MKEKLKYLGLNLNKIPESLKLEKTLSFKPKNNYEEKKYKQYKYLSVNEIEILFTPTNRLDGLKEKYEKALPLYAFLLKDTEENIARNEIFLNMIDKVSISEIEAIEQEQQKLSKKIPFKVKYSGNFLWQIYYSENDDKYFMLVPLEDSDYSALFYLLKKKLEKKKTNKIFVPISNVNYSKNYLKKTEFEDIENYMWLFTKDWPNIYEVYNKKDEFQINIIGETEVYEKVKSIYKVVLNSKEEANRFYKLLKAIFILQTELPKYYKFLTNIGSNGEIEFYFENEKIEYELLSKFINNQYFKLIELEKKINESIQEYNYKLSDLKSDSIILEKEFFEKEKQITTFLECKKTFFGRVKYFFKYSKKNKHNSNNEIEIEPNNEDIKKYSVINKEVSLKKQYTLEELINRYKEYELTETELKDIVMDVNALKLKNKNLIKKIENAVAYIEEIDKHKKSIFEFWKYSNKDEQNQLPEGEKEEINIKKITKVFDYEQDLEEFGIASDKYNRKEIKEEYIDSIYITTTNILDMLNKIKCNDENLPKCIENNLKALKQEAKEQGNSETEEIDIFGGLNQDSQKIRKIATKNHREIQRDKFKIIDIGKGIRQLGYKLQLENIIQNIDIALKNSSLIRDVSVYKISNYTLLEKEINVFNINPINEIRKSECNESDKYNFYKINLKRKANAIPFTNIVYYENKNKTLPLGMDLSTNILVDVGSIDLRLNDKKVFRIAVQEDKNDEFSEIKIKTIYVFEYEQIGE